MGDHSNKSYCTILKGKGKIKLTNTFSHKVIKILKKKGFDVTEIDLESIEVNGIVYNHVLEIYAKEDGTTGRGFKNLLKELK